MFKFLTALLGVLDKVFDFFNQHHWKQQGRQEAIKEAADELEHQIELGEAATSIPDPDRTERLRSKYDRSRQSQ